MGVSTKLKGDVAEQSVTLIALKHGWEVLHPVGDRLPYDLVLAPNAGCFVRIQVKAAYLSGGAYVIESRKCKTNRVHSRHESYVPGAFDFAIGHIAETEQYFVFPISVFLEYAGQITLYRKDSKTKKLPRAKEYEGRWDLLEDFVKPSAQVLPLVG